MIRFFQAHPDYSAFAAEVTLIVSPSRAPSSTTLSPISDFTFSSPSSLNTFLSLSWTNTTGCPPSTHLIVHPLCAALAPLAAHLASDSQPVHFPFSPATRVRPDINKTAKNSPIKLFMFFSSSFGDGRN